jgi:hypothetical protein
MLALLLLATDVSVAEFGRFSHYYVHIVKWLHH